MILHFDTTLYITIVIHYDVIPSLLLHMAPIVHDAWLLDYSRVLIKTFPVKQTSALEEEEYESNDSLKEFTDLPDTPSSPFSSKKERYNDDEVGTQFFAVDACLRIVQLLLLSLRRCWSTMSAYL